MQNKLIAIAILLLALFLRVYQLPNLPPSLNWDEVSIGYNAYSVLKSGQDEWGQFLPLSFRIYGDYKLPAYIYMDIPFIALFGLNGWGVRLLSALAGIGLVVIIYLLLKTTLKNETLALLGMFLTAVTPWPLFLSRVALEANLALFLTSVGFLLLIWGMENKKVLPIIISSLLFGLSIFTYNSSRVVTPLLIFFTFGFYLRQLKPLAKKLIPAAVIFVIFFTVAFPLAALQDSSARYKWTTILDEGAINQINEMQGKGGVINKLIYNKVAYFISHAALNYLSHFNPQFLFISGGSNYQFNVPGSGLLYLIYLPFLLIGVFFALMVKSSFWLSILGWLFLAPVPAAITRDTPHALRSLMMIPPLVILTSFGIYQFVDLFKNIKWLMLAGIILLICFSFGYYWRDYQSNYSKNYSWAWQYGYQQAVDYISDHQDSYQKIFVSKRYGEPHEFLLFYQMIDPAKYRQDPNLIRYFRTDWYWVDSFGKYSFLNDWQVKEKAQCQKDEKCLLITSPGNFPSDIRLLQTVNFLNGQPAFDIVELNL